MLYVVRTLRPSKITQLHLTPSSMYSNMQHPAIEPFLGEKKKKISYFSKPFQARILRLYLLSWVGVWWIIKFSRNALQNKNKNITQPLWPKSWDLRKENLLVYEHSLEVGKAFCSWHRSPHSYCRMGSLKLNKWLFKKKKFLYQ